jgi:hypothetical protein
MNYGMRRQIAALLLAVAGLCTAALTTALGAMILNLDSAASGNRPISGLPLPWLQTVFRSQIDETTGEATGKVYLEMKALHLSLPESGMDWSFNIHSKFDGDQDQGLRFARTEGGTTGSLGLYVQGDSINGFAGLRLSVGSSFSSGQPSGRLGHGDSVQFLISMEGQSLRPEDFFVTDSQGHYLSSGMIGAVISEPSTYIVGALLLIPLLFQLRRSKRQKARAGP